MKNLRLSLRKKINKDLLGPFLSGILLTLSFPKWNLHILSWFFLVPLLFCRANPWISGLIFGWIHFSTFLYWLVYTMTKYGGLSLPFAIFLLSLLSLYLAFYYSWLWGIHYGFLKTIQNPNFLKGLSLALSWVGIEYLRSKLFTGFPWGKVGYLLSNYPVFLQSAEIWGVWGLSFLLVLVNYWIYLLIWYFLNFKKINLSFFKKQIGFLIILILVIGFGFWKKFSWEKNLRENPKTLKVALLQGNIPQELKKIKELDYSFKVYTELSFKTFSLNPDLILFPETAFPFYFPYERDYTLKLIKLLTEIETQLSLKKPSFIVGIFRLSYTEREPKIYNSLVTWNEGKIIDFYDKEKLVPFGEYVPLGKYFPFLKEISVVSDVLKPGTSKNLTTKVNNFTYQITPLICFESAFPELLQKRVKEGSQLVFIATNDAWFGRTSAPYQHFQMAQVRAVEARRYTIQVANTGITGVIDPLGKVLIQSQLEEKILLEAEVKPFSEFTYFVKYGNFWGLSGAIFWLLLLTVAFTKKLLIK